MDQLPTILRAFLPLSVSSHAVIQRVVECSLDALRYLVTNVLRDLVNVCLRTIYVQLHIDGGVDGCSATGSSGDILATLRHGCLLALLLHCAALRKAGVAPLHEHLVRGLPVRIGHW